MLHTEKKMMKQTTHNVCTVTLKPLPEPVCDRTEGIGGDGRAEGVRERSPLGTSEGTNTKVKKNAKEGIPAKQRHQEE